MIDQTYCEECFTGTDEEKLDYRFDRPVCQDCVYTLQLTPDLEEGE
jgi:hypothetical protein